MSPPGPRLLIVDDEKAIRRLLRTVLSPHGFEIFDAATGQEGVSAAADARPDLIILDLGLPDLAGIDVIRKIREWSQTPIVVLSAHHQEGEKVAALEAGADDYVTKPFGSRELLARIRAALRHLARSPDEPIFTTGGLTVDLARRLVTRDGQELRLSPIEYDLLKALILNAGKVVTHRSLLREVWGQGYERESHLLRVTMSNLRHKLEPIPARPMYIRTEPGVGYRMREADDPATIDAEGRAPAPLEPE
jgi:two-component system KDP operon response regulator KdpE